MADILVYADIRVKQLQINAAVWTKQWLDSQAVLCLADHNIWAILALNKNLLILFSMSQLKYKNLYSFDTCPHRWWSRPMSEGTNLSGGSLEKLGKGVWGVRAMALRKGLNERSSDSMVAQPKNRVLFHKLWNFPPLWHLKKSSWPLWPF